MRASSRRGIWTALALTLLGGSALLGATTVEICNMAHNSSPATTACIPIQDNASSVVKYTTMADLLLGTVATTDPRLPTFNVRASPYNAVGDGVADDSAAIQAAIAAACTNGRGRVLLPAGDYRVTSTLTVTCAGVWLSGSGPTTTVIHNASAAGDLLKFGNTSAPFSPCGGVRDLSLNSAITKTAGSQLVIDGCGEGAIENIKIFMAAGGNGITFGATTSALSALWYVNNVTMTMTGAFTGLSLASGNDRYFSHIWIQGNRTSNGVGIKITGSAGDWFSDIESVSSDHGVLIAPAAGATVSWLSFYNTLTDSNLTDGYKIVPTGGSVYGITIVAPWGSSNGTTTASGHGVVINGSSGSVGNVRIVSPRIINNGGDGISVTTASDIAIEGGFMSANSQQSSGTYSGIAVTGATGIRVSGVRSGNIAGGSNTQKYGLAVDATSTNVNLVGNDLTGNLTGALNNLATLSATVRTLDNLGVAAPDSYFHLLGAAGGMTIYCGTGSGEDCTFHSTSHATKGQMFFGPLTVDEAAGRVGIGATVPDVPLEVSANAAALPSPVTGSLLHVGNADATATRLTVDSFGAGGLPGIDLRRAAGTAASPTALTAAAGDGGLSWEGYDGSAWSSAAATVGTEAAENWTTGAHGMNIFFSTVDIGTLTLTRKMVIDASGHLLLQSAASPTVACTGTGTSPTAPSIAAGSTDQHFLVTMPTGTGSPGSTGTCTVTFAKTYASAPLVCMLVKGATAWGNGATIQLTTESSTAPVFTWTNLVGGVATALTVSTSYKFYCLAVG